MQCAVNSIARVDTRSNDREATGAETLEGLVLPFHVLRAVHGKTEARADRDSEVRETVVLRAVHASKHVRGAGAKSSGKAFYRETLRGGNPKGASGGRRANNASEREGLSRGSKPRNRGSRGPARHSGGGSNAGQKR
jgi:hypothetical protein